MFLSPKKHNQLHQGDMKLMCSKTCVHNQTEQQYSKTQPSNFFTCHIPQTALTLQGPTEIEGKLLPVKLSSYWQCSMETLTGDLLLELKFVRLGILLTSFTDFLYDKLGQLRSRFFGLKRIIEHVSETWNLKGCLQVLVTVMIFWHTMRWRGLWWSGNTWMETVKGKRKLHN